MKGGRGEINKKFNKSPSPLPLFLLSLSHIFKLKLKLKLKYFCLTIRVHSINPEVFSLTTGFLAHHDAQQPSYNGFSRDSALEGAGDT